MEFNKGAVKFSDRGTNWRLKLLFAICILMATLLTSAKVYAYNVFVETHYVYLSGYINLRVELPDGSNSFYRVNCSISQNDYAGSQQISYAITHTGGSNLVGAINGTSFWTECDDCGAPYAPSSRQYVFPCSVRFDKSLVGYHLELVGVEGGCNLNSTMRDCGRNWVTFATDTNDNGMTNYQGDSLFRNATYVLRYVPDTYTVNYDGNGATGGSMSPITVQWNQWFSVGNGFEKKYTVTYNANGGTTPRAQDVLSCPFLGWYDPNVITASDDYTYVWQTFEAPFYANANRDVFNKYGYNKYALVNHFNTNTAHGTEYRKSSKVFDLAWYVNHGGQDLKNAFGTNKFAYLNHWNTCGCTSGRAGNAYYSSGNVDTTVSDVYPYGANLANLTTEDGASLTLLAKWGNVSTTLPTPTRTGYNFKGWSTNASATSGYTAGQTIGISSNVTLYALWEPWKHTVAFDANGGDGAPAPQTKTYGSALTLSSQKPTREGFTFLGWSTNSNATSASYAAGGAYGADQNGESVTLYAVWQRNKYTVTYDYATNGGTKGPATSKQVLYGYDIDFTVTAEKNGDTGIYSSNNADGWQFVGWNTEKNATTALTSMKMPASDVKLYAIYKKTVHVSFVDYNESTRQQQNYSKDVYNKKSFATFSEAAHHNVTGWNWRFWSVDENPLVTKGNTNWEFSKDVTLYGCYEKGVVVTFVTDRSNTQKTGVRYTNSYDFEASSDPSITAPSITNRYGWSPLGFSPNEDCEDLSDLMQPKTSRAFKESCNMYAIYKQPVVLTYSNYNYVGTQKTQKSETFYNASGNQKPASFEVLNGATKTGVEFTGWNSAKDGKGTHYSPSQIINLNSDTTLYACFGKISGTVLTSDSTEVTVLVNGQERLSISSDKVPIDNYSVTWSSSDEKIAKVSTDGVISGVSAGDVTITAVYTDDINVKLSYRVHVVACSVSVPARMSLFESKPVSITFSDNNASLGAMQKSADLQLVSTGNLFLKRDKSVFFELNTFVGSTGVMQPVSDGDNVLSGVTSKESVDVNFQPKVSPNIIPSGEYQASAIFQLKIH